MVLRPVGPLPPGAYWFRRLFVIVLVLIVVLGAWWFFSRDSPDQDPASGTPAPTVLQSTPSTTAPTKPKPTKKSTPPPSPTVAPCDDQDINVTVKTNAESYPAGQLPTFTLTVENISKTACSRDVGTPALELRVSSGGSKTWSSDDCNPGGDSKQRSLEPGDRYVQSVQWDRGISEVDCPTPQDSAVPGDYQVVARNLEVFSDPVPFVLQ